MNERKITVVGIGGAGCRIMRHIKLAPGAEKLRLLVLDSDTGSLEESGLPPECRIIAGMNLRDAFALPLLAMDYEKDSLNTPRIAAAVDAEKNVAMLGIVRHDALLVKEFALEPGKIYYLSTYEKNAPCACNCDEAFDSADADALCAYMIYGGVFADFEKPVTAAGALWNGSGYSLAVADAKIEA